MKHAPYRLYDPHDQQVVQTVLLADEPAARAAASRLVEAGEYTSIEIHRLEDGLHGYDYYRVGTVESHTG